MNANPFTEKSQTDLFERRLVFVENRLTKLEERLSRVEYKTGGEQYNIPDHYMYLKEFCDRYLFISDACLGESIKKHGTFFEKDIVHYDNRIYIDPKAVIRFMESGLYTSKRIVNQYKNWCKHHEDLKKLVASVNNPWEETFGSTVKK